ncbi:MAG: F0F1 ATP synthase subunit A [Erysipelotrichaceae bacterium]|nr:F0F1 ATP synthase subunit A [Erysipelotrichaceae bacterium]MBQ2582897.1 F0F1 ATP synthase subunit A [Erysipelotrichaceae bacterium]
MKLQTTVFSVIIITVFMALLLLYINRKLKAYDPLSKPTGIVLMVIMFAETIDNMVKGKTNERVAKYLTPYIMSVAAYIFLANIAGLFALETPTSNYSVTLVLAVLTCILIEVYSFRERGGKGYLKSWFEPLAPFVVLNVLSKISTLLSLSLRLFGNILSGGILMSVIYQMLGSISKLIPVIGKFNIVGVIVAPVLHFYFDLFSGVMQAFIFITLTVSFIGKELPNS